MKKQQCEFEFNRWISGQLKPTNCSNGASILYRGKNLCFIHHTKMVMDEAKKKIQKQQSEAGGNNGNIKIMLISGEQIKNEIYGLIPEIADKVREILNLPIKEIVPAHTKLSEFEKSTRLNNVLNNYNIIFIGQLASKTLGQIINYKNLGRKGVREVEMLLAKCGWKLGTYIPESQITALNTAAEEIKKENEIKN